MFFAISSVERNQTSCQHTKCNDVKGSLQNNNKHGVLSVKKINTCTQFPQSKLIKNKV